MKQHYVEFMSPGTFLTEATRKEVGDWDVDAACAMASGISERHGAKPFGFRFITRERADDEIDAKTVATSGTYYLGGKVETLAEVKARATEADRILISNMEGNNIERIVTNRNSFKFTAPLNADDVVLPAPAWATT